MASKTLIRDYAPPGADPTTITWPTPKPKIFALMVILAALLPIGIAFEVGSYIQKNSHPAPAVLVQPTQTTTPTVTPSPTATGTIQPTMTGAPITATPGTNPVAVSTSQYACVYQVGPGNTLASISAYLLAVYHVNLPVEKLVQINNLSNPNVIRVGQSLLICAQ